jgi:hypothetical protein
VKADAERAQPARGDERWAVVGCVGLGLLPVLLFVPKIPSSCELVGR